jgi:shikimate kinase
MRYKFIDTDELIEKSTKAKIKAIFEKKGEDYFREKEKKVLHETLKEKKAVIATGGGMPCFFDNMQVMNENGVTVYLEASPGILFHRLIHEKERRPLLMNLRSMELMDYINTLLERRKPFYEKAKIKVDAETITSLKLKKKINDLKG